MSRVYGHLLVFFVLLSGTTLLPLTGEGGLQPSVAQATAELSRGLLRPLASQATSQELALTNLPAQAALLHSRHLTAVPALVSGTAILGIQSDAQTPYGGMPWLRLAYRTCGHSNLSGQVLKDTIQAYHQQGLHILLDICQPDLSVLLQPAYLQDAAAGQADAVQCGNEQMKYDPPFTRYVPPALYAQFFDRCEQAVQARRPGLPTLMGSLDPHVVGPDNGLLAQQVAYLKSVETAMNTSVHPAGSWHWRSQLIGMIDIWHNGYPSRADNNLYQLLVFWARQFQVNLASGQLAQHLWVVEGTPCVGCGLQGAYQLAVSHIITLITDVLTVLKYHIPFFYFTGKDFNLHGRLWSIGVLDLHGHPKPLRQDLPMGARTLQLSCSFGNVNVAQQEHLLALLYAGCQLPSTYLSSLTS